MAGAFGVLAGAAAAALIAWVTLSQSFYRQPFGDRGALGLWLLAIGLDVGVYLAVVGGYAALGGVPRQHSAAIAGSILAGISVPLALRSPIRTATIRGTTRSVGITYAYDYLRAVVEDPLDGKLAELRRVEERRLAERLQASGWTAAGLLAELEDHLDHLQRRSEAERATILATATKAAQNLESPKDLRGIIVTVRKARCSGFLKLKDAAPR